MNRQEAIEQLKEWLARAALQGLIPGDVVAGELQKIVKAFSGPTPDPDTGLVPCGCGGKAIIWPSNLRQATHVIIDYEVGCTECAMTTGWVRGKQEHAMKIWNTAMGHKGGAE